MSTKKDNKGDIAEEALRQYFKSLGFLVIRNVPFMFSSYEITDVDLFLYMKKTTITRDRINVDVKRKRTPQAIERIFWTKGLQQVLNLDSCIVATTDKRIATRQFGALHDVIILDGKTLKRIIDHYKTPTNELSEKDFISALNFPCIINSKKEWTKLYRECKKELLVNLDFNAFNKYFNCVKLSLNDFTASNNKSESALRILYTSIAFMLVTIDYKSRHIAPLDTDERKSYLIEGFRYGEAGKKRADEILETSLTLAEYAGKADLFTRSTLKEEIDHQLSQFPAENLADYLSKSEAMKSLFELSKRFYNQAYQREIQPPKNIEPELKSLIALLIDCCDLDRRKLL